MTTRPPKRRGSGAFGGVLVLALLVVAGVVGKERYSGLLDGWNTGRASRQIKGEVFGSMPAPTQPDMKKPVMDVVAPKKTRKMVVKRIPQLEYGKKPMPHPYWGPCTKCHLIKGGAPAGSQPITPVGKMWEKASSIHKVGPPILPNSTRHHPPSGRCIKCHDIVVDVPI